MEWQDKPSSLADSTAKRRKGSLIPQLGIELIRNNNQINLVILARIKKYGVNQND